MHMSTRKAAFLGLSLNSQQRAQQLSPLNLSISLKGAAKVAVAEPSTVKAVLAQALALEVSNRGLENADTCGLKQFFEIVNIK